MKFIKNKDPNNNFDTSSVTLESEAVTLDDILFDFASFLRACGYTLPNNDCPLIINEEDKE